MPFPRWYRCPRCKLLAPLSSGLFKAKKEPWQKHEMRYLHEGCPKVRGKGRPPEAIPARFVIACENGHLDDFPWRRFICGSASCNGLLRLREQGLSIEVADIWAKCDKCGTSRSMAQAFVTEDKRKDVFGACTGRHPHNGLDIEENCERVPRAVLTGSTNLWFPMRVSVLSLPVALGELGNRVAENWNWLLLVDSRDRVALDRELNPKKYIAFSRWSDDELWAEVKAKLDGSGGDGGGPQSLSELKVEEWEVFTDPANAPATKNFIIEETEVPEGYEGWLERVVLFKKLRVVNAFTGFTRIGSPGDYGDLSEIPEARRAPLQRSPPTWVPAAEVKGEGIFIQFKEEIVERWVSLKSVCQRQAELRRAHVAFRSSRGIEPEDDGFEAIRFTLIHTFSHLLLRQLAVDCGYDLASMQERIYSQEKDDGEGKEPMAGVLIYTAASDSEGTLGGLVARGDPEILGRHLDDARRNAELCSSDPLCSEHEINPDGLTLHGAACHSCTFVPETACERGNKYLDRTLIVETMAPGCDPFFGGQSR